MLQRGSVAELLESLSSSAVRTHARRFVIVAMLLAGVGIVGVTAYYVQKRTNEIGIRMALGASDTAILSLVFKQSVLSIGGGIVAGDHGRHREYSDTSGNAIWTNVACWLTFLGASIVVREKRSGRTD